MVKNHPLEKPVGVEAGGLSRQKDCDTLEEKDEGHCGRIMDLGWRSGSQDENIRRTPYYKPNTMCCLFIISLIALQPEGISLQGTEPPEDE